MGLGRTKDQNIARAQALARYEIRKAKKAANEKA
jgi:hypothetical protein